MNVGRAVIFAVAIVVACGLGCHGSRFAQPSFQLVSPSGRVIISDEDLVVYRWSTHTMVLEAGTVKKLCSKLHTTAPFEVEASGVECYQGQFVSPIISASFSCPVIQLPITSGPQDQLSDTLSITLGYPTGEWFQGNDPRGDSRILEALVALGKVER